ncbi:MAG TPA: peptidoglycan DD-metalloendopeptidase family protein [Candidatus Magasanikbacteria bacterium]|nr:peptidoglycan DD-metalloendopeptidase family protein [Candidatus Magasanikbacteria bacterium]
MKKFLLFILLFSGFIFGPNFVFSQINEVGGNTAEIEQLNKAIAEKKAKIKDLEDSIIVYKEKIKQTQLESTSLKNQMSLISNRIAKVELDIKASEERLEFINLEIEVLSLEIENKENLIKKQKMILGEMIRTLYYNGNKNYLEIAATYDNFSDFYSELQYLRTVEQSLGKNVTSLQIATNDLQNKKTQNEEKKKSYENLKKDLLEKKKDYNDQKFLKQDLLNKSKSNEKTYSALLNNLNTQYRQIENEISSIEAEVRRKLAEQNKLSKINDDITKLSWPTQSRYITAYFHDPDYPYRHIFEHSGIDIRAAQGTPIKATASGYVGTAKYCSSASCYSYVLLIHSNGLATLYGHLSKIIVSADKFVTRGDIIGYSGGTPGTVGAGPFVTGPHLHFEVRKNGIPTNPLNYLVKDY